MSHLTYPNQLVKYFGLFIYKSYRGSKYSIKIPICSFFVFRDFFSSGILDTSLKNLEDDSKKIKVYRLVRLTILIFPGKCGQ